MVKIPEDLFDNFSKNIQYDIAKAQSLDEKLKYVIVFPKNFKKSDAHVPEGEWLSDIRWGGMYYEANTSIATMYDLIAKHGAFWIEGRKS